MSKPSKRLHDRILARSAAVLGVLGAIASTPLQAQDDVRAILRAAEAAGVRCGCVVRDVDAGADWVRHGATRALIPASNQKIVTIAAFLHGLGADYEFRTGFEVRDGDLVVHAGGDPNWVGGTPYDARLGFAEVGRRLSGAGIDAVRSIVLEPGPFTGPSRPDGWPSDQFERSYCAPTGGLLLDAGCFRARVSPSGDESARIEILDPPGGLPVDGAIRMTDDRKRGSVWGLRHASGRVDAFGAYWTRGQSQTVRAAVRDAAEVYRGALATALQANGIAIRPASPSATLARFDIETPALAALAPVLADSSNVHAEQCLRVLGAETAGDGSFDGGVRAVRSAIADLFDDGFPDGVVVADGSGLSRGNRLTAAFTVDLLERIARSRFAEVFVDALAHGGIDGTLERRFRSAPLYGNVRAKTGTIRGVSALSGFVHDADRRLQVFSILMNVDPDARVSTSKMRRWQDQIVAAIHAGHDVADVR